jgi:very-short-patch-repair endonuclease
MIARLAGRQHGVVARWQLLRAGVTARQIAWRLRTGRLHEIHRGVCLVGHEARPPHAHEMAALLAYDGEAVLSHRSAAALWGLLSYPATAPVWVTIRPERNATRPRIRALRARLEPSDIRSREGLPLTGPPRTILDMACLLPGDELESLVAEASYRRLAREGELREQLGRNPRKPGGPNLRAILDSPGGARRTRSPAERLMLRMLRASGITGYGTNARIHGYEVDFLWGELGFAVEIDGYEAHSGRAAFERDRLKIATLEAHGVSVMPITGRQLRADPEGTLSRLRWALALAAG